MQAPSYFDTNCLRWKFCTLNFFCTETYFALKTYDGQWSSSFATRYIQSVANVHHLPAGAVPDSIKLDIFQIHQIFSKYKYIKSIYIESVANVHHLPAVPKSIKSIKYLSNTNTNASNPDALNALLTCVTCRLCPNMTQNLSNMMYNLTLLFFCSWAQ